MSRKQPWGIALALTVSLLPACGESGGLSRSKAEKLIEETVNKNPAEFPTVSAKLGQNVMKMPEGEYRKDTVCLRLLDRTGDGLDYYIYPSGKWQNWGYAFEKGFFTITTNDFPYYRLGQPKMAIECHFNLTEKATPYLLRTKDLNVSEFRVVERIKAKVTGLSKPAQFLGQTVSEAEVTFTYEFNPLGKALAEPIRDLHPGQSNGDITEKGNAVFRLYDDGWRLVTK